MTKNSGSSEHGSLVQAARNAAPADVLFTNAEVFNPYNLEWKHADVAVKDGIVLGSGRIRSTHCIDVKGRRIVPGLIDAHVHIESSLLSPPEFASVVSRHGTTTIVADPHEIANVCGWKGIEFMLGWRGKISVDLFIMLPSCVPATPLDVGGATLTFSDLVPFKGRDGILGLGEVMNVKGVLSEDPELMQKIGLFSLVDGHAPLLSGPDLNAYITAGVQSDHECSRINEAEEKLEKGMYLFIREGSTEKNLAEIIRIVSRNTVSRCSFATDDRHADLLVHEGHIDDCIRKAIACGLEEELAIHMATLSPAERFSLRDRGALSPGMTADFCLLEKGAEFSIERTYRKGKEVHNKHPIPCPPIDGHFHCTAPEISDIRIEGHGNALVIGLVPHQIITRSLTYPIRQGDIPDLERDILKAVVCSRYRDKRIGSALVQGFGITSGAIAGSVSHDSHNIVAVGAGDNDIIRAISLVIQNHGGLVAVSGNRTTVLPLECAGLMSIRPYEEVDALLHSLNRHVSELGGREDSFMYLSFLALSVIPSLRITENGLFDTDRFMNTPVFQSGETEKESALTYENNDTEITLSGKKIKRIPSIKGWWKR